LTIPGPLQKPNFPWESWATALGRPERLPAVGLELFHFVSREALQCHCHIFDGRMFIVVSRSPRDVPTDFIANPQLSSIMARAARVLNVCLQRDLAECLGR
jgi:hypothetical protein